MSEIKIRPAEMRDLETLLRFEQGVIETERPFDPTLKKDPIHYYDLEEMIRSPHIHLVVAESETGLIASGYARIEEAKSYLDHAYRGYLGFMYTLPSWRGKGVNRLIIDELKKWSTQQNLKELRLDAYFENEKAIRAYEKSGFTRHMIHMRMGLDKE
jgi:GNAT superfamily N-acetyltransferase